MNTELRFNLLDGARGVAAIGVLAAHIDNAPTELVSWGAYWVEFFFVLSGFVLYPTLKKLSYSIDTKDRYKNGITWIKLRLIRFWTVWIPVLTVLLVIQLAEYIMEKYFGNSGSTPALFPDSLKYLLGAVFLAQIFFENSAIWHGPAWSLSVEIWVNFIAVMFNTGKHRYRQVVFALLGLILLLFTMFENKTNYETSFGTGFMIQGFSLGLFGFFLGMITREIWNAKKPEMSIISVCFYSVISVTFIFLISQTGQFSLVNATIMTVISSPLVFVLASVKNRNLSKKFVKLNSILGESSFGVYLIHPISLFIINQSFNGVLNWLFVFAITSFFTIISALILKRITESTLLRIFKKLLFVK